MSHLADNVVLLQHVLDEAETKRVRLSSRREPASSARIRELRITLEGILLGEPFSRQPFLA